jgi:hypothetical protein
LRGKGVEFFKWIWVDFKWVWKDDKWILEPLRKDGHDWRVTVEKVDGDFWVIFVAGSPLNLRFSNEQGAKLSAWEFVKAKGKAVYGTFRKPRLVTGS